MTYEPLPKFYIYVQQLCMYCITVLVTYQNILSCKMDQDYTVDRSLVVNQLDHEC